eukprot:TRINITY_DN56390_c0_g1_i1.p1 TRINITY_DN56390_c0_g1~~TRINITY_DN56390_c0_g1_i1.p1  ORF type:complete len:347 (+),score=44.50 TRINITY_DN56390_c0_g1_i1:50-1090(+)
MGRFARLALLSALLHQPGVGDNSTASIAASKRSSCFDHSVVEGSDIAAQSAVGDHGSISIVNGASGELWIQWMSSEADNGPFALAWTSALKAAGVSNYWWMNDASHSMGLFKLAPHASVLLPYMGVSTRVAPSVGCNAGTSPQGKLSGEAGRAIVASCSSSRGGTPSPQTLVEWTFTPSPYDVIDSSFVDGYSMPVRLEYKKQKSQGYTTLLGLLDEASCSEGGGVVVRGGSGKFEGCQSPCSATGSPADCCAGAYNRPETCHPGGHPVSPAVPLWCDAITRMFSKGGKRLGYCYAYDDEAGSIVDHEKGIQDSSAPRVKVTFCDYASVSHAGRHLAEDTSTFLHV